MDWRSSRKTAYDAAHPGKYYGVGFAASQRRFGNGAEASFAKVEIGPDGSIALSHTGTEIGTGTSSGQAVACVRWLGRPADRVDLAVTDWPELPVETSGDPLTISQSEQDRLAENPRWSPVYASGSSASNSSYYFTHTTREAARIVFSARPVAGRAGDLGRGGPYRCGAPESARWSDGVLTVDGMRAAGARATGGGGACPGFGDRRGGARIQSLAMGGGRFRCGRRWCDAWTCRFGRACACADGDDAQRYQLLDRRAVFFPSPRSNNAMVSATTVTGALAELAVDAATGKVALLTHHTILECGNMLVPELVSGQIQGGAATGIGLALHEYLPLYEEGPGDGTWNFNRYHLPRGGDVAVWTQTRRSAAAAVRHRTAEGHGGGGGHPDHRRDRERHRPCHRPSLPRTAGDAGSDPVGAGMSPATRPLTVTINGQQRGPIDVPEGMMMIDVLHEMLDLTGSRLGCGQGMCHACVVIWDRDDRTSEEVPTCITGADFFNGKRIRTIEGIAQTNDKGDIVALSPVQQAFLDQYSFQCGYCTPGFVNAATVLIERLQRAPIARADVEATVAAALETHICRCTGYVRYYQAVRDVILATPGLTRETI